MSKFREKCLNFDMMNNNEKFKYLMCADGVNLTAEFIYYCCDEQARIGLGV